MKIVGYHPFSLIDLASFHLCYEARQLSWIEFKETFRSWILSKLYTCSNTSADETRYETPNKAHHIITHLNDFINVNLDQSSLLPTVSALCPLPIDKVGTISL